MTYVNWAGAGLAVAMSGAAILNVVAHTRGRKTARQLADAIVLNLSVIVASFGLIVWPSAWSRTLCILALVVIAGFGFWRWFNGTPKPS